VAVARHNGGKRAESAEAFEKLLAEFADGPHAVEAHVRAGQYWLSEGKEPLRSIPHFEAALALSPEGSQLGEALKGLGLARYESKDMDGAAQTFVALIQQAPDVALNESAYAWAGQYLFDRERWAEAALAMQALLNHVPDYPDRPRVRLKIGECFERSGDLDAALKQYESLAADASDTPAAGEARFRIAGLYEKKNDLARAAEIYEQVALAAVNGDVGARAQFRLGELRATEGKFAEAARHYMRVAILYLHPELSSEALWRAGQCFEQGGDKEQAVKSYQEVVRDHPDSEQAAKAKERLAALAA
jgi:TolA-binding protein